MSQLLNERLEAVKKMASILGQLKLSFPRRRYLLQELARLKEPVDAIQLCKLLRERMPNHLIQPRDIVEMLMTPIELGIVYASEGVLYTLKDSEVTQALLRIPSRELSDWSHQTFVQIMIGISLQLQAESMQEADEFSEPSELERAFPGAARIAISSLRTDEIVSLLKSTRAKVNDALKRGADLKYLTSTRLAGSTLEYAVNSKRIESARTTVTTFARAVLLKP